MTKDLEMRKSEATQQEKKYLQMLSEHEQDFHSLIIIWLQQILCKTSPLPLDPTTILNSRIINSVVENSRKNPKIDKNVENDLICTGPMSRRSQHEILGTGKITESELERSQSPYSIALDPEASLRLTKRPPRPQSQVRSTTQGKAIVRLFEALKLFCFRQADFIQEWRW